MRFATAWDAAPARGTPLLAQALAINFSSPGPAGCATCAPGTHARPPRPHRPRPSSLTPLGVKKDGASEGSAADGRRPCNASKRSRMRWPVRDPHSRQARRRTRPPRTISASCVRSSRSSSASSLRRPAAAAAVAAWASTSRARALRASGSSASRPSASRRSCPA